MARKSKKRTIQEAKKIVAGTPDDFAAARDLLDVFGDEYPDLDIDDISSSLELLDRKPEPKTKAKPEKKSADLTLSELDEIWAAVKSSEKAKPAKKKPAKKKSAKKTTKKTTKKSTKKK